MARGKFMFSCRGDFRSWGYGILKVVHPLSLGGDSRKVGIRSLVLASLFLLSFRLQLPFIQRKRR